jgi:hypothetical protein
MRALPAANRHIILLMDNFSGHTIEYKPTNIVLEYFEPNMTPFVQPCDAGIIWTFKALYRKSFNQRAIDRDEAGEREIYKIDLLEAMSMAQKSWQLVSKETIKHCWGHTLIQPYVVFILMTPSHHDDSETYAAKDLSLPTIIIPRSTRPFADPIAWKIIREYATTDLSRPDAEIRLEAHLGDTFKAADWEPALRVITEEEDSDKALKTLDDLEKAAKQRSGLKLQIPARPTQLIEAETHMMATVQDLKSRNRVFGDLLTVDDILDPPEEREQEEDPYECHNDDIVAVITEEIRHEIAVENGEVIQIESDDEDDSPADLLSCSTLISLCAQIQSSCLHYGDPELAFELSESIRKYHTQLNREELKHATQTRIEDYLASRSPHFVTHVT